MAKGQKIGSLFYDIDGDNREALKKLEQVKKEAVSIQKIMQDVMKSKGQVSASQLGNEARRNALNQARIDEIANRSTARQQILQQQLAREVLRTEQLRQRMLNQSISSQNGLNNSIGLTNKTMFSQKNLLQQLSSAAGIYFSIYQAGAFVKELAMVSGEFEKQRLSLRAIIQNSAAADRIFNQIKDLAVYSPFNFKELTDYAKQLSAFSIPTNEIFDTMKRLADVSAGLGVDMNRIILAYGQVRSAAVLRGQELRQFTEAGIPLVDELAKKFSELSGQVVRAGDVFDKISNREVPFEMIKEIFTEMTSEGGKFYNMQEIQAKSLAGMISNLRDAYDIMLDSIGSANSETLKGAVQSLVDIMDNWRDYFNILKTIIAAYGVYRATLLVVSLIERANLAVKREAIILMRSYAAQNITLSKSQAIAAAQTEVLTRKLNGLKAALSFNMAGLALSGITIAIGLIASYLSHQEQLESQIFDTIHAINEEGKTINGLLNRLKELSSSTDKNSDVSRERLKILNKISETEPNIAKAIKDHTESLEELTKVQEQYNNVVNLRKFATYASTDSEGLFSKNLLENLKSWNDAQFELDKSTNKLIPLYGKLEEAMYRWKIEGKDTLNVFSKLSNESVVSIDNILKSADNIPDKIMKIRKLATKSSGKDRPLLFSISDIFDGAALRSYANASDELREATNKADKDIDKFVFNINGYLKANNLDLKENESTIRNLIKSWDDLGLAGQKKILLKLGIEWEGKESTESELSNWQIQLQKVLDTTITIQVDSNLNNVIDEMGKKYKELKSRMDDQKPILVKFGFDFEKNNFPSPLEISPVIKQLADGYVADKKDVDNLDKAAQSLGKTLKDLYDPKDKGDKKDKFTEDLKRQVDLVKSAKSEYDKLIKLMSSSDAISKIKGISEYSALGNIDLSDAGYINYINEQLKKIENRNTTAAKNIRLTWNKELGQIKLEGIIKEAKKAVEQIEKELSKYKEQYSLYETLLGITGDKSQSLKLAFGDISEDVKTYSERLKEEIANTTDVDLKKKLEEQLADIEWTDKANFTKQMAELVKKYQTVEEQIATVRENGERKRLEILKNADNASEELLQKRLKANQEAINEEVAELTNGVLQSTESYQRLFGDLSEISTREVKYLIEKWNNAINNATKKADGSVSINIDDTDYSTTEKELASFSKRMIALDKELRDRNPFKALIDSINVLKNNKAETTKIENEIQELENTKLTADRSEIPTIDANISKLKKNLSDLKAKGATDLQLLGVAFSSVASDVSNLAYSISSMFEAFGDEKTADTIGFIGELASSLGDIGQGISSGNYVQAAQGVIQSIVSIANFHDKKLDRAIKRSQLEVKRLQNAYKELERIISRQLGSVTEKQASEMVKNQEQQITELEKQIAAEKKKKKSDKGAILDMEDELAEAKDQLKHFYEDLASEQYGIDLKGWAGQIADALVNAFASGEDAAKAFDDTVADIMRNVIKNMIQLSIIEPAMEKLRTELFGEGGLLAKGTTNLSKSDGAAIVGSLMSFKDAVDESQDVWDYLSKAAEEAGISLTDQADKDTLSKGIQSVTEDTANLLASYLNAIRADVSAQKIFFSTLIQLSQANSSTFANMYAELMRIQVNTLRTADNTTKNVELVSEIKNMLKNVTTRNSGYSINV